MKHWNLKRVLSLLLVVCMVTGLLSGVSAMAEDQTANYHEISTDGLKLATEDNAAADETETEEAPYADTDVVRVFVVLEDKPVLQQGYATRGIAGNAAAMAASKALEAKQAALAAEISANVLSGETLNVHWNLTLAANAMSVDLPYGKMDEVEALKGVKSVMLVPQYSIDPREQADLNTISSGNMIGSYNAWLEGYTGAGSRIAIVDTGLDSDHPSFNSAAFDYSLLVTSTKNGKQIADYNLLTAAKINEVLPQLHAAERYEGLTGNALYVSSKIAFGFNYIDATLDITHDNDQQGDHGTHVAGIATANRYVENADGTYTYADNGVVGVAPDAQVVVMKVLARTAAPMPMTTSPPSRMPSFWTATASTCPLAPRRSASRPPARRTSTMSWILWTRRIPSFACLPVTPETGQRTPSTACCLPRIPTPAASAPPAPMRILWPSPVPTTSPTPRSISRSTARTTPTLTAQARRSPAARPARAQPLRRSISPRTRAARSMTSCSSATRPTRTTP